MGYKALLTDVDRTLVVQRDALPTEPVREAIRHLDDTVHFGLATSRPYEKIQAIVEYLELTGPSIVSSGGQIVNLKTGEYYHEYPIPVDALQAACRLMQNDTDDIRFWVQDDGTDYDYDEKYNPKKPFVLVAYGMSPETADRILPMLSELHGTFSTKVPSYEEGLVDIIMLRLPSSTALLLWHES